MASNNALLAKVNFPSQVLTTIGQQVRIGLLPLGSRQLPTVDIETAAAINAGDETLDLTAPTTVKLWAGEVFKFETAPGTFVTLRLTDSVDPGATTLPILPAEDAVAANLTVTICPTLFIAGATDASPSSSPKTVDTTNFNSGVGNEMAIVGTNRTLNFSFNRVVADPGGDALMQTLFNDEYYNREVFALIERENGEVYSGAAIATTGSQTSPVQDLVKMQVNLQFQGASFSFDPGPSFTGVVFPD